MYTQIHRWSYLTASQLLRAFIYIMHFSSLIFFVCSFFLFLILHYVLSTPVSGQDKETRTPSAVCAEQSQNLSAFLLCLLFCNRCKMRSPPRIQALTREASTMKNISNQTTSPTTPWLCPRVLSSPVSRVLIFMARLLLTQQIHLGASSC